MSREITNKLLEMVDDGLLDARTLALACLKYMSEDDVEDMAVINEFIPDPDDYEDEEEEYYDYDPDLVEKTYDYIINAGDYDDELDPYHTAYSTKEEAIEEAKKLLDTYEFTEVVYMPEDDEDINEVVWRSWEVK